jgi:hypothetical protein
MNAILRKFIRFYPHIANLNISLSDEDQKHLDKLKFPDFIIEKEKSKFPTPPSNPSRDSTNYKSAAVEIPSINIDRSQY